MRKCIRGLVLAAVLLCSCGSGENLTYLYEQEVLHTDLWEAEYVIVGTVTELLAEYREAGVVQEQYQVPTVLSVDRVFADRTGSLGDTLTVDQYCYTLAGICPEPLPHLEVGKTYFLCIHIAPDGETHIIGSRSAAEIAGDGAPVGLLTAYREAFAPYETAAELYEAVEGWLSLPKVTEPDFSAEDTDEPWEPGGSALYGYPVLTERAAMQKLYSTDGYRPLTGIPFDDALHTITHTARVFRSGFPYYRFTAENGIQCYVPAIYPEYME
ncbi:MAG: hypothetical protein IJX14_06645 [Clostridia bacterium]|nr:hypothetical protein [Clostridia bacterium]